MARCVICGGKRSHRGSNAAIRGWCDDCYERIRQEDLAFRASPPGTPAPPTPPTIISRKRRAGTLYYAFFVPLTLALLVFALFKDTVAFRFLLTDRASAIAQLTRETEDEEFVVQNRAITDLVKIGGQDAVQVLIGVARDTERASYKEAIAALGKIGGKQATDALIGLLDSKDLYTYVNAANALAKIGHPVVARLIAILDGDSKGNVSNAAMTLGMIDDPAAQARLQTAFDHQELKVIVGAIDYYIGMGKAGTEKVLISALNKSDDIGMASSLLNCGNSTLEKAARTWASENGYKVTTFPFIGRDSYQQWGGGY